MLCRRAATLICLFRVNSMSPVNWKENRTKVGARFVPAIIEWLGYDPRPLARSSVNSPPLAACSRH